MIGISKMSMGQLKYNAPSGVGLTMEIAYTGDPVSIYVEAVDQDIVVDWGDGNTSTVTAGTTNTALAHIYASNGNYDVEFVGKGHLRLGYNGTTEHDWTDIKHWGTEFVPTRCDYMFDGCNGIGTISATDSADFDLSNVTNMYAMFNGAINFNGDIGGFDTSSVTNMSFMFFYTPAFNGDISGWDTSSVTSMNGTFYLALTFNGDISSWDTSSVIDMNSIFYSASSFNQDISAWDTSSVTNMTNMFYSAGSFNQDLSGWDVSSVANSSNYDVGANAWLPWYKPFAGLILKADTVDGWYNIVLGVATNTGESIEINFDPVNSSTFQSYTNTTVNSGADVGVGYVEIRGKGHLKVGIFNSGSSVDMLWKDVMCWGNLFEPTDMTNMLSHCDWGSISATDAARFNMTSAADMTSLFENCPDLDGDFSDLNTANVTTMDKLLYGCSTYNTDLTGLDVSSVTSHTDYDTGATSWQTANKPTFPVGLTMTVAYTGDAVSIYAQAVDEDIVVDWGDGNTSTVTAGTTNSSLSHSYASNGNYDVEFVGKGRLRLGHHSTTEHDWTDIKRWGGLFVPTSCSFMFDGCDNIGTITATDSAYFDLSNVTDMSYMFQSCTNFNGDLSGFDTSNVNNMFYTFFQCTNFNGDISTWNVSSVTTMLAMMYECENFNQDISGWNTSSLTDPSFMFKGCFAFNQPLNNWNTSLVTDMREMFWDATSFNQPLNSWNTSLVTNMSYMFENTIYNQPLNNWDTSSVIDMEGMFYNANSFNQDLSGWNVSNVTNNTDYDTGATAWQASYKPVF